MNQTKKLTFDNFSKIYVSDIYLNAYLKNIDLFIAGNFENFIFNHFLNKMKINIVNDENILKYLIKDDNIQSKKNHKVYLFRTYKTKNKKIFTCVNYILLNLKTWKEFFTLLKKIKNSKNLNIYIIAFSFIIYIYKFKTNNLEEDLIETLCFLSKFSIYKFIIKIINDNDDGTKKFIDKADNVDYTLYHKLLVYNTSLYTEALNDNDNENNNENNNDNDNDDSYKYIDDSYKYIEKIYNNYKKKKLKNTQPLKSFKISIKNNNFILKNNNNVNNTDELVN